MNENEDPLKSAVDEVDAVAKELRELRQKIHHYGNASERLDNLGESLVTLSESVTMMHGAFLSILQKADLAQGDMEKGRQAIAKMVEAFPSVVERIEASDVSKGVAESTQLLSEVREVMNSHRETMQSIQRVAETFSGLSSDIKTMKDSSSQHLQLLQLVNQVLMQNVAGPLTEHGVLINQLKHEIQSVRSDISSSKKLIEDQREKLDVIANKRGLVW